MNLILIKYLSASLILLMTLAPGIWILGRGDHQAHTSSRQQSLARGIFFGLALLHMMPKALSQYPSHSFPWPMLACALFFILLLWLEHLVKHQASLSFVATLTLSVHSILMGSALGLSTELATTLTMLAAILMHKLQESYALATLIKKSNQSKLFYLVFALMTPLGILYGAFVSHSFDQLQPGALAILMGASAGSLLYLGTLHGYLPNGHQPASCCNIKLREFIDFFLGFLAIILLELI